MSSIFISHASKDIEVVKAFIDELLVGALAVKLTDIFCTGTDGTKIKSGEDWRNEIREHLIEAKITFLIITPHYKESEVCLNEMGAAWVLSNKTIPLIIEPIDYDSVGVLQQVKQVEKLQGENSLDRVKDIVQDTLNIPPGEIKSDRWTVKKSDFLERLAKHLTINPFKPPVTREHIETLMLHNLALREQVESLVVEKFRLEKLSTDLKEAISSREVAEIEKKHLDLSILDEFKSLCSEVHKLLKREHPIVRGVIFSDYSGKDVMVRRTIWSQPLDEAIARDILKDDPLEPNWYDTKVMRSINSALDQLRNFIRQNETNDNFLEAYDNEFEATLSISNLDFWKEVLELSVMFD